LGLDPEGLVIGTVSRLHLVKRVDLLIRAFGLVRASHSEARLVVVGDGPEAPRLRELAQREGVGQAVSFLGAREDALRLLAGFDIYALCSAHEGGPFALLEAMAVGCAVVATPVGLAPEMLEQASAGILLREATPAALAGALEGLASSRAVRDRMGAAGREFVATHLSLGRAVGEYVQLYRSVAEEHPCVVGGG
jgi:glycosyltransferase involved in cell wall biosynthesis